MDLHPVSFYTSLKQAKGRREHGCFLVEGPKILSDLLGSGYSVREILLDQSKYEDLVHHFPKLGDFPHRRLLESRAFSKISDTLTSQGVVGVAQIPAPSKLKKINTLVLNGIQDPGNAGTLIRTAAAFSVTQILYDSQTADPFSPKVIRASAGAFIHCAFHRSANLCLDVAELRKSGFTLYGLSAAGTDDLSSAIFHEPYLLVIGSEGNGVSPGILSQADSILKIHIQNVESLNAAIAGSIALYGFSQGTHPGTRIKT